LFVCHYAVAQVVVHTKFDKDPSDIPITIKAANFALGQSGRRWQVYLNGDLVAQVTDGSSTTTLKAVKKGDYTLKVALATDDKTIVATAGLSLDVGPAEAAPAPTPAPAPSTLPKTGSDVAFDPQLPMLLLLGGLFALAAGLRMRHNR
jgi:hypothetical protein